MQVPKEWFSNPIFTFVVGGGMGIVAGVTFAMVHLYPAHEGRLRFEVEEARHAKGQYDIIAKENGELKKSLRAAQKTISDAHGKNVLAAGNPYPLGFDQVKIGDKVDAVGLRYSHLKIEKSTSYWSVSPQDGVIKYATYYFDQSMSNVTHISFAFGPIDGTISGTLAKLSSKPAEMLDHDFLRRQLVRAFGQPTYTAGMYQKWSLPSGEGIYVNDKERYILMAAGYVPTEWPTTGSIKK